MAHRNARLTPAARLELVREVQGGWSRAEAAKRFRVSRPTVSKWLRRYREEGEAGLELRRTKPYRPQTNGKTERFIRILQDERAYARPCRSNEERLRMLPRWLYRCNHRRPHGGIGGAVPASRL